MNSKCHWKMNVWEWRDDMSQMRKETTKYKSSKEVDMRDMTKEERKQELAKEIETTLRTAGLLSITIHSELASDHSFMILRADTFSVYEIDEKDIPKEKVGESYLTAKEVADAIFYYREEKVKEYKSNEYEYEQN